MRPLRILHIEDNEGDALLFKRACEVAGLSAELHLVRDGAEAMAYLQARGDFARCEQHPPPDIVVLDLKMPGLDGFDFLKWLRNSRAIFSSIPVLVFTNSRSPEDRSRALREGAAGYFVKPMNFETLVRLTESFKRFQGGNWNKN